MTVFISHRQADSDLARIIADYLHKRGIPYYLDVLDSNIISSDITTKMIQMLNKCTHLLAVLSHNTEGSWWVPFEIGGATKINRRIASYSYDRIQLPDYLQQWPNMYSLPHLDAFIMAYKADQETASLESYTGRLDSDLGLSRIGAYQFHNNLKAALSMQNY